MPHLFDLVGKIGSMALIRKEDNDLDYNIFARLGRELRPGMIWVTSGAAEIGRLDYMQRNGGAELCGDPAEVKTDYSAQGQNILMAQYRQFIPSAFSVRQVLVEHRHFNDPEKRAHIQRLLIRAPGQNAIPIINYNDPVSDAENLRWELASLRESGQQVHECVDNDETAAIVAELVQAKRLLILTSTEGIYLDVNDPSSLVGEVSAADAGAMRAEIERLKTHCVGASRAGANGAWAKLDYITAPVLQGTQVIIGNPRHHIRDLLNGSAPATRIGIKMG